MTPQHPKMDLWRSKCADSTITLEDYRELVVALREGRDAAAAMLAKKPPKPPKEPKPKKPKKGATNEGLF